MEKLSQKYIKYFYLISLISVAILMGHSIYCLLMGGYKPEFFMLILLSIMNIILLSNGLKCSTTQRFTECKINAGILRVTFALLIMFHTFCLNNHGILAIMNGVINICMIEFILSYRIKNIEYLENLADHYVKNEKIIQKEDK